VERWEKDVTEIIRNCLAEVFVKLQSAVDTQRLTTELPSPSNSVVVVGSQSFEGYMQQVTNPSDPRNAFFAILRRAVKTAMNQFLDSCLVVETLNEQKKTFRVICERAIRKGFGDGAADACRSQPLSTEAGTDTVFGMLWALAWPGRGPAVQALKSTLDCRKAIHEEVMDRLNHPQVTDRSGIGPFLAKMYFQDCDKSLRLACSVLQNDASEDFVGSLDHLISVETAWNGPRRKSM
jgi:hypothetical protein